MRVKRMILGLILFLFVFPKIGLSFDEEEINLGYILDRSVVAGNTLVFNDALNKKIDEIGNRVANASDGPNIKYRFRLVSDAVMNARAMPGGFVYINTGLLDVVESKDELASIIAHEIAHINRSHMMTYLHQEHRKEVVGNIVGIFAKIAIATVIKVGVNQYAGGASYDANALGDLSEGAGNLGFAMGKGMVNSIAKSMINGYGKKMELEADALGVKYAYKAGYDPYAAVRLFKRFNSIKNRLRLSKQNYASSYINAEPGLEERIRNLEKIISYYEKNQTTKENIKSSGE